MPVYIALVFIALAAAAIDRRHRLAEDMRSYALLRLARLPR